MKIHLLWFAGFLIALGIFVALFRSYEDRHRFVLIRSSEGDAGALMWDRKLHHACIATILTPTANQTYVCQ